MSSRQQQLKRVVYLEGRLTVGNLLQSLLRRLRRQLFINTRVVGNLEEHLPTVRVSRWYTATVRNRLQSLIWRASPVPRGNANQ